MHHLVAERLAVYWTNLFDAAVHGVDQCIVMTGGRFAYVSLIGGLRNVCSLASVVLLSIEILSSLENKSLLQIFIIVSHRLGVVKLWCIPSLLL